MKCLSCGENVSYSKGYPNTNSCWTCGCKTVMANEEFPKCWADGKY